MKIIFSRKGFDSSFGGCPSPIEHSTNKMMSFPIPGGKSPARFSDIQSPWGDLGALSSVLGKRPALKSAYAHLDPDLTPSVRPRLEGWLPSLGQVDAAQSHLQKQNVGVGDVFIFFGWFRPFEFVNDTPQFVKGSKDMHSMFGYMQIGEVVHLGANPSTSLLNQYPWLHDHPHMHGTRSDNNTLYIASSNLTLNGVPTELPGASSFDVFHDDLKLTAPNCSKSVWRVPSWMHPDEIAPLSYHGDPSRWFHNDDEELLLRTVAKGQEFVFDSNNDPRALDWIQKTLQAGLGVAPLRKAVNGL